MAVGITGGTALTTRLDAMARQLKGKPRVNVGFLEGSTERDGTSLPMVAFLNEYGRAGQPPRPYFRRMVTKHKPQWADLLGKVLAINEYNATVSLSLVGGKMADQLRESIVELTDPPLSPVTIMLRGMRYNNPKLEVTGATVGEAAERVKAGKTNYGAPTKPLVDTGTMLAGIRFHVTDE